MSFSKASKKRKVEPKDKAIEKPGPMSKRLGAPAQPPKSAETKKGSDEGKEPSQKIESHTAEEAKSIVARKFH